jgi:outer membrane protein TolC
MQRTIATANFLAVALAFQTGPRLAPVQAPDRMRQAEPPPAPLAAPAELHRPTPLPDAKAVPSVQISVAVPTQPPDATGQRPALPDETGRPLPINLATALRLADARPLIIEAARAAVETEYGLYQQARVLWLPSVYLGADYQRHDGGEENILTGQTILGPRNQFLAGGGAQMVFALTDAIYSPLAERQLLRARNLEIQTAKNDALLSVALAYFDVQQARGTLAGTLDSVAKARDLARRVEALGRGLAPRIEVERVNALLANLEQQGASFRQDWLTSSATLARVLRLDPAAVVVPLEPPHLHITLISPKETVDALIPVGLTNRPELATQQAVVQATLVRLRQERLRPLLPSLVLQSNATPTADLGAGVYGTGTHSLNHFSGRSDWDAEVVWQLKNLGFGNRGLITQRRGEQRQAQVELFRIQDMVADDVAQARAQVQAAAVRVGRAEAEVKSALVSYQGNLKGLSETVRAGDLLQLVNRPQEVVAALQQLQQAYINYFTTANDYNRAQFRLFRALGYPAQGLACGDALGAVIPVDPSRPAPLPRSTPRNRARTARVGDPSPQTATASILINAPFGALRQAEQAASLVHVLSITKTPR